MTQCQHCNTDFTAATDHQRYCSHRCRTASYRVRKKQQGDASPPPVPEAVTRHSLQDATDDELFNEACRRAGAQHNEIAALAQRVAAGESFAFESITKKQQATLKRFARDHEAFNAAVSMVYSIAARQWASDAWKPLNERLMKERKSLADGWAKLKKERDDLSTEEEHSIRGDYCERALWDIDEQGYKRFRSFLHPDKHHGCSSADKVHKVALSMEPLLDAMDERFAAIRKKEAALEKRRAAARRRAAKKAQAEEV